MTHILQQCIVIRILFHGQSTWQNWCKSVHVLGNQAFICASRAMGHEYLSWPQQCMPKRPWITKLRIIQNYAVIAHNTTLLTTPHKPKDTRCKPHPSPLAYLAPVLVEIYLTVRQCMMPCKRRTSLPDGQGSNRMWAVCSTRKLQACKWGKLPRHHVHIYVSSSWATWFKTTYLEYAMHPRSVMYVCTAGGNRCNMLSFSLFA